MKVLNRNTFLKLKQGIKSNFFFFFLYSVGTIENNCPWHI